MPSIKQTCNAMSPVTEARQLSALLTAILADITALRTAQAAMATKLNADAGVTDTNYAAPAALTTTA